MFDKLFGSAKKRFSEARAEVMTPEQVERADFFLRKFENWKAEIQEKESEWQEIGNLYAGQREADHDSDVNAYVNVVLPNIEGQVASMTNHNITTNVRGKGVSDQKFASSVEPVAAMIAEENDIKQLVKRSGRRYLLYGNCCTTVVWDPDALDGFGLPEIKSRNVTRVCIDGKIKDMADVQKGDYIIEDAGVVSIEWAKHKFGEEKARAVQLGNIEPDFSNEAKTDDQDGFTLLRVWTRLNKDRNLQLLELSRCGVLLSQSDPTVPYHKYVFNRYPVFFAGLYPEEGEFYRFGDGLALKPLQELINKLYDEIVLAVKFSSHGRTYADPNSGLNPDDFARCDPRDLLYMKNPGQMLRTERGVGLNQVVFKLLEQLFIRVQEVTRFSALMTGNSPGTVTATQAGIQMQQGAANIDDKRYDLSRMFGDALSYAVGLCMEHWSAAKAFRVVDDPEDFVWVDVRNWQAVPEKMPADGDFLKNWKKRNPKASKDREPKWMNLTVGGVEATKQLEFDIGVSIGEGLPNNKMALYNVIISLSQLMLIDEETGQPRPALTYQQVTDKLETILGIKIENEKGTQVAVMPDGSKTPIPALNMDSNVPNANVNGLAKGGTQNAIQP